MSTPSFGTKLRSTSPMHGAKRFTCVHAGAGVCSRRVSWQGQGTGRCTAGQKAHPHDEVVGPPQQLRIARHQRGDVIIRELAIVSDELLGQEELADSPHLEVPLARIARVAGHVPHAPRSVHDDDTPAHPIHARCSHAPWHRCRLDLLQSEVASTSHAALPGQMGAHLTTRAGLVGCAIQYGSKSSRSLRNASVPLATLWGAGAHAMHGSADAGRSNALQSSHLRLSPTASHSQLSPAHSVPTFFALISAC
eukprot:scaffold29021_cov67-Phaeocystis_antarctica.AAC.4